MESSGPKEDKGDVVVVVGSGLHLLIGHAKKVAKKFGVVVYDGGGDSRLYNSCNGRIIFVDKAHNERARVGGHGLVQFGSMLW